MTKELTPLEALDKLYDYALGKGTYSYGVCYNIIETALKDYEQLKIVAKPLTDEEKKSINSVARRLKALEIIKDNLNIEEILFSAKGVCNSKDYDLLKEVLK